MMVSKLQVECAKRHGHPSRGRRLETEACWVDQWDDGHGHAAIWKVDAASASVVLNKYTQEVLVSDTLCVRSSLHTSHHELILGRDCLDLTLLLFLSCHFVLDFG